MAETTLETEIEIIQESLRSLTRQIEAFEAKSKATIKTDRKELFDKLLHCVESVEKTVQFLESGESRIPQIERIPGSWPSETPSKDVIKAHSADMQKGFSGLRTSANSALYHAETIKEECDDLDVSLDRIRNNLRAVAERADTSLTRAQSTLASKEAEIRETKQSVSEKKAEIQEMEKKFESKKEDRNILRVVRGAALVTSVFFPPALTAVAALEIGAAVMRTERKELQDKVKEENTRLESLNSEKSTLDRQKRTLDGAVKSARSLQNRCAKISSTSSEVKELVEQRLVEYHDVVVNTDDFGGWIDDVSSHTSTMQLLGVSESSLRRATAKIVTRMLESNDEDVRAICGRLGHLTITFPDKTQQC